MSCTVIVASASGAAEVVAELRRYECLIALIRKSSELLEALHTRQPDLVVLDVGFDDEHTRAMMRAIGEPPLAERVSLLLISDTTGKEEIAVSIGSWFRRRAVTSG